jgi:uncharacterized protein (TIGR02421 family)
MPKRPWQSYKERVARLAQRIVDAQGPIRVLNTIKWDIGTLEKFRASGWKQMPQIGRDYYERQPLGFDVEDKKKELLAIEADVKRELGDDRIGQIMAHTAHEYVDVASMLEARGTKVFHELSAKLYGTPKDYFADGKTQVRGAAMDMYDLLTQLDDAVLGPQPVRDIGAERAVEILNERLGVYFGEGIVSVILDDGIMADAAAGSSYIKIRQGALFSERDLRLLEVHEGWVHVATTMAGKAQPVARWLGIGPPRVAAAQEGLAALLEVLTLTSHPRRARRLNDRVLAVDKSEDGANFLEVFEWFRTEGYDEETCFWNTQRVFRGGMVEGGAPFTKDIVYTKGIVLNYNFLTSAIATGRADLIRWLFVGKVAHEDLAALAARAHEGVVKAPKYVPFMFQDLTGLAIWLGHAAFWGRLENKAIQEQFRLSLETTA